MNGVSQIEFTVYGKPEPQGSTRAFLPKGHNRPIITTDNAKLKPWRQQIVGTAQAAMSREGFDCWDRQAAVGVRLVFWIAKPNSVPKRRAFPIVKPDVDKLARAVLDALTGVIFSDDAQVTDLVVCKRYGTPERVEVVVTRLVDAAAVAAPAEEFPLFADAGVGFPKTPVLVGR